MSPSEALANVDDLASVKRTVQRNSTDMGALASFQPAITAEEKAIAHSSVRQTGKAPLTPPTDRFRPGDIDKLVQSPHAVICHLF